MGLRKCDRGDCQKILCEKTIFGQSRFICDGCLTELLFLKRTWPRRMTLVHLEQLISGFLISSKDSSLDVLLSEVETQIEFNRMTDKATNHE